MRARCPPDRDGGRLGTLGPAARTCARMLGRRTDRGQTVFRQAGGLPRGATLPRRPAGETAEHPAHAFVVGRVRLSGFGVMVADRGPVHAERRGRQALVGPPGKVRRHRCRGRGHRAQTLPVGPRLEPAPGSAVVAARAGIVGGPGRVDDPANVRIPERWGIGFVRDDGSLLAHPSSPLNPLSPEIGCKMRSANRRYRKRTGGLVWASASLVPRFSASGSHCRVDTRSAFRYPDLHPSMYSPGPDGRMESS